MPSDLKNLAAGPTETTPGLVVGQMFSAPAQPGVRWVADVTVTPTQVRRPWRSTARTIFQALIALATLLPFILTDVYDSPDAYPAVVVQVLAVAGVITRIMANPRVEEFLRRFIPFLAAAPSPLDERN